MEYIFLSDLSYIGEGANSKVYKYNKPLYPSGLSAVVKIGRSSMPSMTVKNYNLLKHTGLMLPAFMEICSVEGKQAILMENLFTDKIVYVSPNSVKINKSNNLPEDYLSKNKLQDITNIDSLLMQMRDVAQCTNGKGIVLDMDMISFGIQINEEDSPVTYKLVDVDAMIYDPTMAYRLYDRNVMAVKEAVMLFVKYFVGSNDEKQHLLQRIKEYTW